MHCPMPYRRRARARSRRTGAASYASPARRLLHLLRALPDHVAGKPACAQACPFDRLLAMLKRTLERGFALLQKGLFSKPQKAEIEPVIEQRKRHPKSVSNRAPISGRFIVVRSPNQRPILVNLTSISGSSDTWRTALTSPVILDLKPYMERAREFEISLYFSMANGLRMKFLAITRPISGALRSVSDGRDGLTKTATSNLISVST